RVRYAGAAVVGRDARRGERCRLGRDRMTPSTDAASSLDSEVGLVLSGTGGVWRVRRADGSVVEASLRGRVKKSNAGRRADGSLRRDTIASAAETLKLAVGDRVVLDHDSTDAWAI